jgi:hypothetical protein
MFISVKPDLLAVELRTYGEDDLALRAASLGEEDMKRIGERAGELILSVPNGLLAAALVRAAIEVLEGAAREPRWKRRRLKGIYPGM